MKTPLKHCCIIFSGLDNSGKSTQIKILMRELCRKGFRPSFLWSRGGYVGPFNYLKTQLRKIFGKKIIPGGRTLNRNRLISSPVVGRIWLWLAIVDLIFFYGIYLRLLKCFGRTIICDRYLDDTWIDFKLNFPRIEFEIWSVWKFLKLILPRPNISFMFLISIEESLRRSKLKNEPFPDSKETIEKRLALYQELGKKKTYQKINCLESIDKVSSKIAKILFLHDNQLQN